MTNFFVPCDLRKVSLVDRLAAGRTRVEIVSFIGDRWTADWPPDDGGAGEPLLHVGHMADPEWSVVSNPIRGHGGGFHFYPPECRSLPDCA